MPGDNLSIGVVSVLFHVPTNLYTTPPKIPICYSLDGGMLPRYLSTFGSFLDPQNPPLSNWPRNFGAIKNQQKEVHPEKEKIYPLIQQKPT